jgi:quercetin 2,3-dioxygenase
MTDQITASARTVATVVKGMPTSDGAGVRMTRLIGTPSLRFADPFLMLDHFNSADASDYIGGFPDHPHRGFETVTYMLEGRMRHGDNKGNSGVIGTGDVQWMRAGSGLIHSEMPEQVEGRMRGFQLWVNLPSHLKMSAPDYQEVASDLMPIERRGEVTIKVIAGTTSQGAVGPVAGGAVDARLWDVTLPAGTTFSEPVPTDHTVLVVPFDGAAAIGGRLVDAPSVAVLTPGETLEVAAGPSGGRFLLIAGAPIKEPVAWMGPFVMNTETEVRQAIADFQAGRF